MTLKLFHIFLILKALEENFPIMKKHRNLSEYITYLKLLNAVESKTVESESFKTWYLCLFL